MSKKMYGYFVFVTLFIIFVIFPSDLQASSNWIQTTNMPISVANHFSFVLNSNIYSIGGSNNGVPQNSSFSEITSDGTLSLWRNTSSLFPSRYWLSGTIAEDHAYILGGADETWNNSNGVFLGNIQEGGNISNWQSLSPLPKTLAYGASAIIENRIYYAGGNTDAKNNFFGSIISDVYMAEINPLDGTIGNWSLIGTLPQNTIAFQMLSINNDLYIFGGRNASQIFSSVYRADIDSISGKIGSWENLSSLPKPIWAFSLTKVGDTIITAGGHNGSQFISEVFYTNVNSDGTLSVWQQSQNSLPMMNAGSQIVTWNDNVYITGGHDGSSYFNDTYFTDIYSILGISKPTPSTTPTQTPTPVSKIFFIPGMGASWNAHAFASCSFDPESKHWSLASYAEYVYSPILTALESIGWNVKPFYYDWRQQIPTNSAALKYVINSDSIPDEKVIIIGHSMGGLVGIDYLKQTEGEKLNSILTIGSPYRGTALAYPPWAGGDVWNDNFLEKIAITLYLRRCGGILSNNRQTIQEGIPSLQNLLPKDPYLQKIKNTSTYLPENVINTNNWATSLSNHWEVKVETIAGVGFDTLNIIQTKNASKKDTYSGNWLDGKPAGKTYSLEGDGTVLTESALLPEASYRATINQTHSGLINSTEGMAEIFRFLGSNPNPSAFYKSEANSALVIIGYPADFKIIDQDGNTKVDMNDMISFINPKPGSYKISLLPKSRETLFVVAQFLPNGEVKYMEYKFQGFVPKFKTLNFDLAQPSMDILE